MKMHSPPRWTTITISSALWNYTCGACRTNYMGVADSEDGANQWGEKHWARCIIDSGMAR